MPTVTLNPPKIRSYAGLKRRVVDPAWPGGTIPAQWLLRGAPQHYDPVANSVAKSTSGLEGLTYGTDGSAYIRDPTVPQDEPDPDIYCGVVQHQTAAMVPLRMWRVRMSQLPALHDLQDGSTVPITLTGEPLDGLEPPGAEVADRVRRLAAEGLELEANRRT